MRDPRELLAAAGPGRAGRAPVGRRPRRSSRCGCRAASSRACATAIRHDPLLRQVLPLDDESGRARLRARCGRRCAPRAPAPACIHKYRGRALLVATGSCAVHCRYCFRRHFPYARGNRGRRRLARGGRADPRATPSIDEVILSGGDPLSLSTAKLAELTDALRDDPAPAPPAHPHPPAGGAARARGRRNCSHWLRGLPWPVTVVLHANHANEFDAQRRCRAAPPARAPARPLLNQAVLLRGVNDSVEALAALSERSFAAGVLPYYLHQLDRVQGAAHFEVDDDARPRPARGAGRAPVGLPGAADWCAKSPAIPASGRCDGPAAAWTRSAAVRVINRCDQEVRNGIEQRQRAAAADRRRQRRGGRGHRQRPAQRRHRGAAVAPGERGRAGRADRRPAARPGAGRARRRQPCPSPRSRRSVDASGKDLPVLLLVDSARRSRLLLALEHRARAAWSCASRIDHVQASVRAEWADLEARRALRRLEAQVRETERRCDALIDSSRDPIAYIHEGMHIRANAAYLEMFGFESFEDIEGMSLLDLIAPQHVDELQAAAQAAVQGRGAAAALRDSRRATLDGNSFPAVMEFTAATYEGEACLQIVFRRQDGRTRNSPREVEELRQRDQVTGLLNRADLPARARGRGRRAPPDGDATTACCCSSRTTTRACCRKSAWTLPTTWSPRSPTACAACSAPNDVAARFGEHQFAVLTRNSDHAAHRGAGRDPARGLRRPRARGRRRVRSTPPSASAACRSARRSPASPQILAKASQGLQSIDRRGRQPRRDLRPRRGRPRRGRARRRPGSRASGTRSTATSSSCTSSR